MSKNIEEIVKSVLPERKSDSFTCFEEFYAYANARLNLKQALTEGKLVVPMSYQDIFSCLDKFVTVRETLSSEDRNSIAEELYQAQFGGNK